jgi:hypothetical protein
MIHKNFREFNFDQLTLAQPIPSHEGGFYSKIATLNDEPLFIQTPLCKTKQGIMNNGKKIHADLLIDIINTSFINWIIMLEERIQQLIYLNKDTWFVDSNIELDDIKLAFSPMLKVYKSDNYLLRCNIPFQSKNGIQMENICQVYDEDECICSMEHVKENTNIISILEFQGIKFSQRIFQININIKQIMILKSQTFNGCQISKEKKELKETEIKELKEEKKELKETEINEIKELKEIKQDIYLEVSDSDDELVEVDIKDSNELIELLKEYLTKKNIKELQLLDDL